MPTRARALVGVMGTPLWTLLFDTICRPFLHPLRCLAHLGWTVISFSPSMEDFRLQGGMGDVGVDGAYMLLLHSNCLGFWPPDCI